MIRRKRPRDPARAEALRAFRPVADAVDAAQRALLQAVPTARNPGAPLHAALDAFDDALAAVDALMPSWRSPASEGPWLACATALEAARAEAARVRAAPPGPEEFEALNARLGDVLSPLEVFAETERRLRGKAV